MNMLRALGATPPVYAHVPMILGPDGAKLSKRHGAVSVLQYQQEGYLPDALLNYLVRLGWSHGDQEVFSREEMVAAFDIKDVNKAASAFNPEKLLWLNRQHLMRAPVGEVALALKGQLASRGVTAADERLLEGVVIAQRERAATVAEMAQNSLFFFREFGVFDDKAAKKHLTQESVPLLQALAQGFNRAAEWDAETIHAIIESVAEQQGLALGKVAQPLRVAVTGGAVSPPIDATVALLGPQVTQARILRALAYVTERGAPI
jgi:glutamyl-tRNA synthetase